MSIRHNYRGLFNNDVVVLRNGDIGIVSNKSIILQSGGALFKNYYKHSNKVMDTNTNYDIIKIYHNYELELVSFNIINNEKNLVWEENIPFPELKNGDVVVLDNDNIYMKVDHIFVNKLGGHMKVYDYDNKGNCIQARDNDKSWNIKKVYRNKDKLFYDFYIVDYKEALIWERS